jgi:PAS domain S-box-containing protein
VRQERQWPDDAVSLLKMAAETVANAMLRRQAEEDLRASETRLRSIVRAAPTGIGLVSDRVFVEANDRVCEMLGYRPEDLVNVPVRGLYPTQEEYDYVGRHMYGAIDQVGTGTVETRWLRKDGRIINVLLSSTPLDLADRSKGVTFTALDITERKRAEQALQESERALRTLMANLPGLAYRCINAPGWPFEFVSGGILALSGYTPEEITFGGMVAYGDLIHPDDRQRVWDAVQDAVARNESFDVEYRIITKDGQEKWVFDRGRLVPVPHGGSAVLEGFVMDITVRKRAEAALRESELRFRDLADLLPQTIFEVDMRGYFTFVNRAGLEQFGYMEQEAPGVTALHMVIPADRERAAENIRKRLAGEETPSSEYTAIRKDGSTFPAFLYSTPILREGKPAGLRGIVVDITELKQAEAAVRESEQNYHEIFNATNDAIFIHDAATGDILDVNRTALETLGYGREEVGNLNAEAAGTGESPFTREDALGWIRKTAREGPQLFEWHTRRKNGDLIWEEVSLRTVLIGGERRVLAVARNITDRKRAETQTQEHLAELTRAWHANTLGEMASGLAHELNQPLCAIVNYSNGCLRLTRKKDYSMDTVRDSIERIAAQAQRAADIIKRIRGLVAKRDPQRTSLDLEVILAEAVLMLRDEALKHNVAIISRLEAGLPMVRGDSVEIEQVVLNLMRNAIEAMSDGQIAHQNLTISTRLSNPEEVEVAVADTGRGISPELSEKIFDSFFTTKRQGLGIGLSLSTRIIEAHGGRLWVESDGRSGATFRFTLPVEGATHGER